MLGTSALVRASSSTAANRIFIYEVADLRQNEQTQENSYPIRSSNTTLIPVPFSRMNEEMQRINRMGGRIVAIHASAPTA